MKELELFPENEENANVITSLGKKYGFVTANTSMLVLESLEQYLKCIFNFALHFRRTGSYSD